MGVSEIGFPQNVVYRTRIQTSDTLPVTIGASKYCEFLFDIDAGDRMTPLGIVGWGCNDKTQVFLLDFYMDNDLQTAKLILKNPYATTIAITSLYIDVLYSKQGLDMSEVDVVDNLTTDSAVAALSAKQGKVLNEKWSITSYSVTKGSKISSVEGGVHSTENTCVGSIIATSSSALSSTGDILVSGLPTPRIQAQMPLICVYGTNAGKVGRCRIESNGSIVTWYAGISMASGDVYLVPINYILSSS